MGSLRSVNGGAKMTTILTVVGRNHGKAQSRIWLEGQRLILAGFTVGARYNRAVFPGCIRLVLDPQGKYKVSGKGEKPIIDTTGKTVTDLFPDSGDDTAKQVAKVSFIHGIIKIERNSN